MVTMPEVFLDLQSARYIAGIWAIPGLTIGSVWPDWMHCCCLGIAQYVMGNIMFELFRELGGAISNLKAALSKLENIMEAISRELGVAKPFHSLSVGMIRVKMNKGPRMKLKAVEARHFVPVLL